MPDSRESLIAVLQLAYSGERAAGYAYRGHWRFVSDADERARIRQIEDEEWHHRRLVGEMLQKLGAAPSRARELRALLWKPSVAHEVQAELDHHLERLEADLVARGVPPAEARARARARFGDPFGP